ncbi:STAS domain-containing protein [Kitasatospora cineracea]|uniref:STAS domain-containing protein n=1 Tax=Kitasatospora cineracea TaxID=88074 RepID=UPI0033E35628
MPAAAPSHRFAQEQSARTSFEAVRADTSLTAAVLHLTGEADHDARDLLEAALAEAVAAGPAPPLVGLAPLTFCGSACLNALLQAHADAEAAEVWMVLVGAGPQLLHLPTVTGADEVLTVRPHLPVTRPSPPPRPRPGSRPDRAGLRAADRARRWVIAGPRGEGFLPMAQRGQHGVEGGESLGRADGR